MYVIGNIIIIREDGVAVWLVVRSVDGGERRRDEIASKRWRRRTIAIYSEEFVMDKLRATADRVHWCRRSMRSRDRALRKGWK
jgi:hypothetical protein